MTKYEELTQNIESWELYLNFKYMLYRNKPMSQAMFNRLANIERNIQSWKDERSRLCLK